MHLLRRLSLEARAHGGAHALGNGGNCGEPIQRSFEIHAGAARDDRGPLLRGEARDDALEVLEPKPD